MDNIPVRIRRLACAYSRLVITDTKARWSSPHIKGSDQQGVCANPDPSTKDFIMQQTMLRIKDPQVSLDFYTRILGMRLLHKFDFPEMSFSLYFVGYCNPADIPSDNAQRVR